MVHSSFKKCVGTQGLGDPSKCAFAKHEWDYSKHSSLYLRTCVRRHFGSSVICELCRQRNCFHEAFRCVVRVAHDSKLCVSLYASPTTTFGTEGSVRALQWRRKKRKPPLHTGKRHSWKHVSSLQRYMNFRLRYNKRGTCVPS